MVGHFVNSLESFLLSRFSESDDTDGNSGLKRILHNNITVNWHMVCLGYQDKFYMEFSFEGRERSTIKNYQRNDYPATRLKNDQLKNRWAFFPVVIPKTSAIVSCYHLNPPLMLVLNLKIL